VQLGRRRVDPAREVAVVLVVARDDRRAGLGQPGRARGVAR